jgi:hypothetical protein
VKVVLALLAGAVLGAAATRLLRPAAPPVEIAAPAAPAAPEPGPARVAVDVSGAD